MKIFLAVSTTKFVGFFLIIHQKCELIFFHYVTVTVESVGMMTSTDLVVTAFDVLKSKCTKFLKIISKHQRL